MRLLPMLSVGALAACSPASRQDEADLIPDPVTTTVTAEGGEIAVPSSGGATLTLTFAPGAVVEPFELTVTPEPISEGELFRVAVMPREMLLAAPLHIGIELPSDLAPEALSALRFGGMFVSADIDAGERTLDAEILAWGSLTTGATPFGRSEEPPPPPPADEDGTDLTTERRVEVIDRIEEARGMLSQLEAEPHVTTALALKDLMHDLATEIHDPESDPLVTAFIEEATDRACNGALQAAENVLSGAGVLEYDDLARMSRPVNAWEAVRTDLDRSVCSASPAATVLEPLAASADAFYDLQIPEAVPGTQAWEDLLGELDNAETVGLEANALEITGVQEMLERTVMRPLIEELRPPAWDHCRETGDQRALGDLLRRFQTLGPASDPFAAALVTDIRTCAMSMTYDSRDANDNPLGGDTIATERPPKVPNLQVHVPVTSNGSLALGGSLRALTCPNGDIDQEEIVVSIDGHELTRLQPLGGEYMPATFSLSDALSTAGVVGEQGAQLRLVFRREGAGCAGVYGAGSHDVVALLLDIDWGPITGWYVGTATFYDALGNVTRTSACEIVVGFTDMGYVTESFPDSNGDMAMYWMPQVFPYGWTPPTFIVRSGHGSVQLGTDGSAVLDFTFDDDGQGFDHTFVGSRQ